MAPVGMPVGLHAAAAAVGAAGGVW
jgi:hypothetical protein